MIEENSIRQTSITV